MMGRTVTGHCPQDTDSDTEVRLQGVHWEVVASRHRQRRKEAGPGRAPSCAVSRSLGLGQCRRELGGRGWPCGVAPRRPALGARCQREGGRAPREVVASSEGESGEEPRLRGSVTSPPGAGTMSPSVLAGKLGTHSLYSWSRMSPLAGDACGVCGNGKESPGKPHRLLRAQWKGQTESQPISAVCQL